MSTDVYATCRYKLCDTRHNLKKKKKKKKKHVLMTLNHIIRKAKHKVLDYKGKNDLLYLISLSHL